MSRLTSDRNQPQQPNQNQQIVQNIQQSAGSLGVQQQQQQSQQFLTISQQGGSYLIINNNNSNNTSGGDSNVQRTPSNVNNSSVQGSIYYPTGASSSGLTPVASQPNQSASNVTAIISQSSTITTPILSLQLPTSSTHPPSPIAKKRLKLDITDSSSSSGGTTEDLAALKKRIYEHKQQRLKSLREK